MRYRTHWLVAAAAALLLGSAGAWAQVSIGVSVQIAPPALPVYEQPPIPAYGYIWVPGYWAWGEEGYYWVPGTWVLPPRAGLLWTPGYWAWENGLYVWHEGYWAPEVGYYGGIDYGFGYDGVGYWGGYWRGREFYYNTLVTRVRPGLRLPHEFRRPIEEHRDERVSFNGGEHGTRARPNATQLRIERGPRIGAVPAQREQLQAAGREPTLRDRFNHGRPPIGGTPRAGTFQGSEVTGTRGQPPAAPGPGQRSIPERRGNFARGPGERFERPAPQPQAPERQRLPQNEAPRPPGGGQQPSARPAPRFTPRAVPGRQAAPRQSPPHPGAQGAAPQREPARRETPPRRSEDQPPH